MQYWSQEKIFDGKVAEVDENERVREPLRIFWTSVLTSWIAPCSVWLNCTNTCLDKQSIKTRLKSKGFNLKLSIQATLSKVPLLEKFIKFPENQEENWAYCLQDRRHYFLLISSLTLLSILSSVYVAVNAYLAFDSSRQFLKNIPLADCEIENQNKVMQQNVTKDFFYICSQEQCPFSTVGCHIENIHLYVIPLLLLISLFASVFLHHLSDYLKMFRWARDQNCETLFPYMTD